MNWKKGIRRTLLGLVALIVLLAVGGWIFLHTSYFNRLAIGKIERYADKSTGEKLSIGKVNVQWSQLKVDMYNVVLQKPSMSPPPFFSCTHLSASIKILSLWHRKFAISELVLNQPAVHVLTSAQGASNLPHSTNTSASQGGGKTSSTDEIFNLGIRHLVITSGEIDYNNQKYPLSADLRDLHAAAQFNVPEQAYRGSLAYDRGKVDARQLLPFEHDLQMEFVAKRSALEVRSLHIATSRTRFSIHGTVADYSHPRVQAVYEAAIYTPDLASILNSPSIPAGNVWTAGSVRYDSASRQPFLDAIYVEGRANAPSLLADVSAVSVEARQVQATYILQHGDLRVPKVTGYALGGSLNASFSMAGLSTRREGRLNASVRGASLSQLTRFAQTKQRTPLGITGKANAQVQAAWAGTFSNAVAHVHATVYGPLTLPSRNTIPVNGSLDVQYNGPRDTATFAPSMLRTQDAQISFSGTMSKHSSLSINANVPKLGELSPLISSLSSSSAGGTSSEFDSLGLRGSAAFNGSVQGSPRSPRISGQFTGNHVFVKSAYFAQIQTGIDLGASGISIQNATMGDTKNGKLTLNGRVGLRNWSFTKTSPVSLQLNASGISVPDLLRLTGSQYNLSGKMDASISVHGSEQNPAGYADISLSGTSPRSANPIRKVLSQRKYLTIHLQGDGNLVHATAQLKVRAGQASATLAYAPKTEHYSGQVNAPSVDLSKLTFVQNRGLALAGIANFSASGDGTIRRPQLNANLQIPKLQFQGQQTISGIRSQFQIANQQAKFALTSTMVGEYVQAKGVVALRDDYPATASVDVRQLSIGPVLASYASRIPADLQGHVELHASLNGPLKQPKRIKAEVQVPSFNLAYRSVQLALAAPMNLHYANGVLAVSKTHVKGTGTNLTVQGTIPLKSTQPMNVSANGAVDLGLLESFGAGIRSSGRIIVNIAARGGIAHPNMQGEIQIASATFLSENYPMAVESLNGKIRVAGTRLEIEQLQGTIGGGSLTASGFVEYGSQAKFNLVAEAKSMRIRYPQGIRTLVDANLNFAGTSGSSMLSGRVLVDRLSFTQQFDIGTLMGQFNSQSPSTGPSAFEQNMKLKVAVASTDALNLSSSKLTIGGNFNLTIAGTAAEPVVLGRVALSQGVIFFMGKRYEIQGGTIQFANPVRTEPVLNVYAQTTVKQYTLTLNFVGPIDRLRTNYTSNPPLSSADIIHLIAFGNTEEQAATSPSTPANVAAESVLAQGVSSQVAGKLEKLTGISQITIDPLVTNSQANPGSQIAVQEQISGSLLLTFSTDVTNTQADTVEVQYTTPQHVRISILRDYNGGYALDVRLRKTF